MTGDYNRFAKPYDRSKAHHTGQPNPPQYSPVNTLIIGNPESNSPRIEGSRNEHPLSPKSSNKTSPNSKQPLS